MRKRQNLVKDYRLVEGKIMDEKKLFVDVEKMLELSSSFRKRIEFAETSRLTESDALRLFESQVRIFESIHDLVRKERYMEAFILNRTVFENYFLISLILKGTKYKLKYKVSINPNETAKGAYERLAKKLKKQCAEGRKDIVSFRPINKHKSIEIVHKGLFSEAGDQIIPVYYFVFNEYDPIRHRVGRIKSISSKELFPEILGKWQKRHEALYKTYLGFRNVLEAALLNDLITNEQMERVLVHYNFLSMFTHLTKTGYELAVDWDRKRHFLLELNLLYVLRILRLYLLLLIDFFSITEHRIRNLEQLISFLDKIDEQYDYFWFIFNEPSEYDIWHYQTLRESRKRKGELLDEKIPYYEDPCERLRRQHQSAYELTTGLTYTSPWPIGDAFP